MAEALNRRRQSQLIRENKTGNDVFKPSNIFRTDLTQFKYSTFAQSTPLVARKSAIYKTLPYAANLDEEGNGEHSIPRKKTFATFEPQGLFRREADTGIRKVIHYPTRNNEKDMRVTAASAKAGYTQKDIDVLAALPEKTFKSAMYYLGAHERPESPDDVRFREKSKLKVQSEKSINWEYWDRLSRRSRKTLRHKKEKWIPEFPWIDTHAGDGALASSVNARLSKWKAPSSMVRMSKNYQLKSKQKDNLTKPEVIHQSKEMPKILHTDVKRSRRMSRERKKMKVLADDLTSLGVKIFKAPPKKKANKLSF